MPEHIPDVAEIVRDYEVETGRPPRLVRKAGGLRVGSFHYPYGALMAADVVGQCRNTLTMIASRYLPEAPAGYTTATKPIPVETTPTKSANAPVEIVHDPILSSLSAAIRTDAERRAIRDRTTGRRIVAAAGF